MDRLFPTLWLSTPMLFAVLLIAAAGAKGAEAGDVELQLRVPIGGSKLTRRPIASDLNSTDPELARWVAGKLLLGNDAFWQKLGDSPGVNSFIRVFDKWAAQNPHPTLRLNPQKGGEEEASGWLVLTRNYQRTAPAEPIVFLLETSWMPAGELPRRTDIGRLLSQQARAAKPVLSPAEVQSLQASGLRDSPVYFAPPGGAGLPASGTLLDQVPASLATALLRVALEAINNRIGEGPRMPDVARDTKFTNDAIGALKKAFPQAKALPEVEVVGQWVASARPGSKSTDRDYIVIRRFPPVAEQKVEIEIWHGFDEAMPLQARINALSTLGVDGGALARFAAEESGKLTADLNAAHALVPPAYLAPEEIEVRKEFLKEHKRVRTKPDASFPADPAGTQRTLRFGVDYYPSLQEATADAKYSQDTGLAGGASYTGRNLMDVGDELRASFEFGEKRQEAEAYYQTRTFTGVRDIKWQGRLGATYAAGDELRFGQDPDLLKREATEAAVESVLQLQQPEDPDSTAGWLHWVLATPRAGWAKQQLTAPAALFAGELGYQGAFAGLKVEMMFRRNHARGGTAAGVGRQMHRLAFEAEHVWPERGDRFSVVSGGAESSFEFGSGRQRNYLLGLAIMGSHGSSRLPLSRMPRTGGDEWLRGLDEGELLGREIAVARLEAGVEPFGLLGRILGSDKSAANPPASAGPGASGGNTKPEEVTKAGFLAVLGAEHGWASRRQGLMSPALRSASSYSLGLDYQGSLGGAVVAHLRLGYAWSPDGLHEKGRVYTSVRFPIAIKSSASNP